MDLKRQYERNKDAMLSDGSICKENRKLFSEFFEFQERKLRRSNGLTELDRATYKTLLGYASRFRVVNIWFKNKPIVHLTKEDIKKVYDDLEDGKIVTRKGSPYKDLKTYYNKIFKSKLFKMAGKDELAREVIEYSRPREEEVRFFEEETFKRMVSIPTKPRHLLLFWLEWDAGENISSTLKLKKTDFQRRHNPDTKEAEYKIDYYGSKLKRSRQSRGVLTNHQETVRLLDIVLENMHDDELLFPFGYATAKKILDRIVKKVNGKCIPNRQNITWKDFRSSMACYLLDHDWTLVEINQRLGHLPNSSVINKYVSYKAMSGRKPKKKLYDSNLEELKEELDESKKREKMYALRISSLEENMSNMEKNFFTISRIIQRKASAKDIETVIQQKERA